MQDGDNADELRLDHVEDFVRKAPHQCAPIAAVELRKRFRKLRDPCEAVLHLCKKFVTELAPPALVPEECRRQVGLSLGPNQEAAAHARERIRAFTSDQGEPAEGSRR